MTQPDEHSSIKTQQQSVDEDESALILIVDDDPVDRGVVQRAFDHSPRAFRTVGAADMDAARHVLRARPVSFVLLDYDLGGLNRSTDLFEDIGAVPFILVTGHGSEEAAVQAMHGGALDYVIKDISGFYAKALPEIVAHALAKVRAEKAEKQLMKELKAALEQIHTLKGLIPICCECKKVRDDDGYWATLEAYLNEHTDASITHSYCPECAEKASVKLDADIEDLNRQ